MAQTSTCHPCDTKFLKAQVSTRNNSPKKGNISIFLGIRIVLGILGLKRGNICINIWRELNLSKFSIGN